jgi:hypothetical protein
MKQQRQAEGIKVALDNGVQFGRPKQVKDKHSLIRIKLRKGRKYHCS